MPPKIAKGKAKQGVRTAKTGSKARKPLTEKEQKEQKKLAEQAKRDKKAQRLAADKTFGLKNKNKSKVVQQHIKRVDNGLLGEQRRREEGYRAQEKEKISKAEAKEAEMAALFGVIDMAAKMRGVVMYNGKKMTRNEVAAHKEQLAREKADAAARQAAFDNMPLTERIEWQRARLDMDKCTRVTAASFRVWRDAKDAARAAAAAESADAQLAGKKKGVGGAAISGLSGRDLFAYDKSLFQDDDAAVAQGDAFEYDGAGDDDEEEDAVGGTGAVAEAWGAEDDAEAAAAAGAPAAAAVGAVDESLYLDDDMGDLDELDDLLSDDEGTTGGGDGGSVKQEETALDRWSKRQAAAEAAAACEKAAAAGGAVDPSLYTGEDLDDLDALDDLDFDEEEEAAASEKGGGAGAAAPPNAPLAGAVDASLYLGEEDLDDLDDLEFDDD